MLTPWGSSRTCSSGHAQGATPFAPPADPVATVLAGDGGARWFEGHCTHGTPLPQRGIGTRITYAELVRSTSPWVLSQSLQAESVHRVLVPLRLRPPVKRLFVLALTAATLLVGTGAYA